jgi:DNA polymerase III alpha subunit
MGLAYCDWHRHTTMSFYDGSSLPSVGVAYAKELGHVACGISDHGTMGGVVEHNSACKKLGMPSLLGVEGYFQPQYDPSSKSSYYHMSLFAKNMAGYRNLTRMMTDSSRDQARWMVRQWAPIITLEQLEECHEGIIMLSGCVGGYIAQMVKYGYMGNAREAVEYFKEIFGEDFLLEVMPFPVKEGERDLQYDTNTMLMQYSKEYRIPMVMTSDAHYVREEEYPDYLWMHKLSNNVIKADYTNLHMHTGDQMAEHWERLMGCDGSQFVENAARLAEHVELDLKFGDTVPQAVWNSALSPAELLADVAKKGLEEKGLWDWDGEIATLDTTIYAKRVIEEFDVIRHVGFENYFLMVEDIVRYARSRGVRCSARGSVCGSLLAYALYITEVDPIILGTTFSRFMRRDKVVMPDVDIDFAADKRHIAFDYIFHKYPNRCSFISNYSVYQVKSLINEMVKIYTISDYRTLDHKEVPLIPLGKAESLKNTLLTISYNEYPISYEELLTHPKYGKDFRAFDEQYPMFLRHFAFMHGQVKNLGQHAAGMAITKEEIGQYMPLLRVTDKKSPDGYKLQTAYNMGAMNELDLMKLDILGLSMNEALSYIEEQTGRRFSYDILNDMRLYDRFGEGDVPGCFQFDGSRGMRDLLMYVRPDNIQELIACNAMYRPGPLTSGIIDEYVAGKYGLIGLAVNTIAKQFHMTVYDCNKLKSRLKRAGYLEQEQTVNALLSDDAYGEHFIEINERYPGLIRKFVQAYHACKERQGEKIAIRSPWHHLCEDTYGRIVYQEQANSVCINLAHMSWGDTDKFIKGISKKNISVELKEKFLSGLQEYAGMSLKEALTLFEGVEKYSFNKNHCAGYTLIALYDQWLREEEPLAYYTAILRTKDMSEKERQKREDMEIAAVMDGCLVYHPHINGGANYEVAEVGGKRIIRSGMTTLAGVGEVTAEQIEQVRKAGVPFISVADLEERFKAVIGKKLNVKALAALKKAHATEMNEEYYITRSEWYWDALQQRGMSKIKWLNKALEKAVA